MGIGGGREKKLKWQKLHKGIIANSTKFRIMIERLLCRGKSKQGCWYFGKPVKVRGKWYIDEGEGSKVEVIPETISQSTGKPSKDRTLVFEGDFLLVANTDKVTVVWCDEIAGFDTEPLISYADWGWNETMVDHIDRVRIIGNKWDGEFKKRKSSSKK